MCATRFLSEQIKQPDFLEVLENLSNPVSPNVELGSLRVESCRIMDSAKRPLWLVWQNNDPLAQKIGESVKFCYFQKISLSLFVNELNYFQISTCRHW